MLQKLLSLFNKEEPVSEPAQLEGSVIEDLEFSIGYYLTGEKVLIDVTAGVYDFNVERLAELYNYISSPEAQVNTLRLIIEQLEDITDSGGVKLSDTFRNKVMQLQNQAEPKEDSDAPSTPRPCIEPYNVL